MDESGERGWGFNKNDLGCVFKKMERPKSDTFMAFTEVNEVVVIVNTG